MGVVHIVIIDKGTGIIQSAEIFDNPYSLDAFVDDYTSEKLCDKIICIGTNEDDLTDKVREWLESIGSL